MYKGSRIAAVVPAYCEEALVGEVIDTMPDFVDHIVVVDDASTDRTADVVLGHDDPRVVLVRHETNRGVGAAIVSGHRRAMELGSDVDVVMAGDAQMDPAYLTDLLDPLVDGRAGFAKANRFFSVSSFDGMPRHRVLGNVVLSFATKVASGYWHVFDPQNGYTAIRRDILERLPLHRVAERYSFENDLLINLNILRVPTVDVPIPAVYGRERSTMRMSRVVPELLRLLVFGFWRRVFYKYVLWSFSPVAMFLFGGLALTLFGLAVGVWVLVNTLGEPAASAGSVVLAVGPLLVGIQMLMYAMLLDIQESPDVPMDVVWSRLDDRRRG